MAAAKQTTLSKSGLPRFGNREVRRARHRLTGTGDGLSKAMAADPVAYEQGDEMAFVVIGRCKDVAHPVIDDEDGADLERIHVWTAKLMAPIAMDDAQPAIERQRVANQKMRDDADGVAQLPIGDPDPPADGDDPAEWENGTPPDPDNVKPIGGRSRRGKASTTDE